jgi:type II secretory pathway pseudopilin PulG
VKKSLLNHKGITLVEVVMSAAILAIVVITVVITVAQSSVFSRELDKVYAATNLAKMRVDDLKRLNFSDLATEAAETDVRIDSTGAADSGGNYIRTTEVDEDYDGNSYLVKVKVSVDRMDDGSPFGSPVVIETLFADVVE